MEYNKTLKMIENKLQYIKKEIINDNSNFIVEYPDGYSLKSIGTIIAEYISKEMKEPWLSKNELFEIYNDEIKEMTKFNNKKTYVIKKGNIRINSSITHVETIIKNDIFYINMKLNYSGDINKYYNPYILIKWNFADCLIYFKLMQNLKLNLNRFNSHFSINETNKVIINM